MSDIEGSFVENPTLMWSSKLKSCNMDKLRLKINSKYSVNLETYKDFHSWSIENYDLFWEEVLRFTNIKLSSNYNQVIDKKKNIADIPQWFSGATLNYAENLLSHPDDKLAIISSTEGAKDVQHLSFGELKRRVASCADSLKRMGITKGDRVVGYIPNCPEAVIAMLAAASFGAIWSSTSPDFGTSGVLDRFTQIQPKVIFSVNAVVYNGRVHDHMAKLKQVVKGLPALEKTVVVHYVKEKPLDLSDISNSCSWDEFHGGAGDSELSFTPLPFNHPLYIMYSSGTTGAPKCMVHSAGGTLIKHNEEHVIQGNTTADDVILYYSTTGWMMWNWLVGGLAAGAAIVLYDGSPLIPHENVLWDLVDQEKITVFGTSAKWIAVLEERGICPGKTHSLSSLHSILSTGSPLKPNSYDYVYREIKQDLLLGSITGGTDIISCFAGQNWTVPVYRGEIQGLNLGSAVESWNEKGEQVFGIGGELVCTKPFPSMPTHFWNDPDGKRYRKAYFEKFPGVWAHGDYIIINPNTGGIVMCGRSDGTLNPSGVRFGSSEIYNIVESFKEVADCVCVAQRSSSSVSEERVVLFLKMSPGANFDEELVKRVKTTIRQQLSARHVPAVILETSDVPYTINSKKVEVAVRDVIAGKEVANRGALANPESLELFKNRPELQGF